jgi:hypothetical protein
MDERVRRHAHLRSPHHMCHRVNDSGRSAQTEIERDCTMADDRELLERERLDLQGVVLIVVQGGSRPPFAGSARTAL